MARFIDRLFSSPRLGTAAAIASGLGALGLSLGALALATALQAPADERVALTTAPPPPAAPGARP